MAKRPPDSEVVPLTPGGMEPSVCVPPVAVGQESLAAVARQAGLPSVGQTLTNRSGLKFEVAGYAYLPTVSTLKRWRAGITCEPDDLYPVLNLLNFSERLNEMLAALHLCTPKGFLIVDTLPRLRRGDAVPGSHYINTISDPAVNIIALDAALAGETHIAHELGHAWVEFVEEGEDRRVLADVRDASRMHQVNFIQSFVLDRWVNDIIAERGFDVSTIQEDRASSVASLGRALAAGYTPPSKREGVMLALCLADAILEDADPDSGFGNALGDTLKKVRRHVPEVAKLARGFAKSVRRLGYRSATAARNSIDACLTLAFVYTGDGIDIENELTCPAIPPVPIDKFANWLPGVPTPMKCEIGRIMAKEAIPPNTPAKIAISSHTWSPVVVFDLPSGTRKGPFILEHHHDYSVQMAMMQVMSRNDSKSIARTHAPAVPCPAPYAPGEYDHFGGPSTTSIKGIPMLRQDERLRMQTPFDELPSRTPAPPQVHRVFGGIGAQTVTGLPLVHEPPTFAGTSSLRSVTVRHFLPGFGSFLTAVREQEYLAGENAYRYGESNPIAYVDPSGLTPICKSSSDCDDVSYIPGWYDNNSLLKSAISKATSRCPEFHAGVMYAVLFCLVARETRGQQKSFDWPLTTSNKFPVGPCQIVGGADKDRICKGLDWRGNLKDHMACCALILCSCLRRGGGNLVKGCGTIGTGRKRRGQFQVINESEPGYDPGFKCCLEKMGWAAPAQEIPAATKR